jgi:hypothetical protein
MSVLCLMWTRLRIFQDFLDKPPWSWLSEIQFRTLVNASGQLIRHASMDKQGALHSVFDSLSLNEV